MPLWILNLHQLWNDRYKPRRGPIPMDVLTEEEAKPYLNQSITNNDPNIDWERQIVRLTFMQWEHTLQVYVSTGGYCMGFTIIESAINSMACDLEQAKENNEDDEDDEFAVITLTAPDGSKHDCELAYDDDIEEQLKKILVRAEIVSGIKVPRYS